MMMKTLVNRLALSCCLAAFIGCGATTGDTAVDVEPQETPAKRILQEIAESGQVGSSAMEVSDELEKMKANGDTAKAEELLADLEELKQTQNPKEVQKKASAMAEKL